VRKDSVFCITGKKKTRRGYVEGMKEMKGMKKMKRIKGMKEMKGMKE
jgi:hypothetical protein